MPLPETNVEWPPPATRPAKKRYERHAAWYEGDPEKLSRVYGDTISLGPPDPMVNVRPSQYQGGLTGFIARSFWGAPPPAGSLRQAKLHIPLAGDIAATSSDLLFGEPLALSADVGSTGAKETTARLGRYLDDAGLAAVLLEAGEVQSAYGGVYMRVGWDAQVSDLPIFDAITPDHAVPEFRSGRLVAVTFWRDVHHDGAFVWRHLERHEPGRILHGLYRGTDDRLGRPMPLAEQPATAAFAELVDADGTVVTGADGLAVEYVPNMLPSRCGEPDLGRSDYTGIEPVMDALDESYTSWLRDLRIGKGRVVVPRPYLQSAGRGRGAYFDAEQEVFTAVDALGGSERLDLQVVQFAIRVAEHQATCAELTAQALRGAGYSAQTFGEQGDVAVTATEVRARERRSYTTRARKIHYWRPALTRLLKTALQIDLAQFKPDGVAAAPPTVQWPDGVAPDPEGTARTIQMLAAAEAASTWTKVKLANPDWDDAQIEAEVKKINDDKTAGAPAAPDLGGALAGAGTPPDAGGGPDLAALMAAGGQAGG